MVGLVKVNNSWILPRLLTGVIWGFWRGSATVGAGGGEEGDLEEEGEEEEEGAMFVCYLSHFV